MPCGYLCSGIYFGLSALEPYLTLSIQQFNCVLDGYARSGTGKNSPKFSAKAYVSIYSTLLGLIEELLRDPYHGRRLEDQLARWAWEGW